MSLLPRASLPSIVCPAAPFLVPRLLRVPTRFAIVHFPSTAYRNKNLQHRTFASKRPQRNAYIQSERQKAKTEDAERQVGLMNRFQEACESREIPKIMALYPFALESSLLRPEHTRRILHALHGYVRNLQKPRGSSVAPLGSLLPFVDRLTEDIRSRKLPTHPMANVHILGILKEGRHYDEGYRFWSWLADQDDTFVDQAVYGAAIELLAYRGQHSLDELEGIYQDGLKRFPGTFAEYHLSPEAVIPDRSRPITIPGIPIGLLQGILTARILYRDYKKAYLALDTALRLYPADVPRRFFELFIAERPVNEAYPIFILACRAGVVFKPNSLTYLARNLKEDAEKRLTSQSDRLLVVQSLANAMYAHMESGGHLDDPNLGNFFDTIKVLLGHPHAHERFSNDKLAKGSAILEAVRNMTSTLMQAGYPNHLRLHMFTLNMAQLCGNEEVMRSALEALDRLGASNPNNVDRRVILQAIGSLGDEALVAKWWTSIVVSAELNSEGPSRNDWLALAEACRRAKKLSYFQSQLTSLSHAIDTKTSQLCLECFRPGFRPKLRQPYTRPNDHIPLSQMQQGLAQIESIINNIAAVLMSGKPLDLARNPLSMYVDPNHMLMASESDLRKVYDEMTTDPHQPELPKDAETADQVHRSPTGIPLDELRFQNWVSINEILRIADATERELKARVDEAVEAGKPLNRVPPPIEFRGMQSSAEPYTDEATRLADLKAKIIELRTPVAVPSDRQHVRWVISRR